MIKQSPESLDPNELVRMETCPTCGTQIPRYRGHVVWCPSCNWNFSVPQSDKAPSRVEKLYEQLSRQTGKRLHEKMMALTEVKRTATSSRTLAYIAATLVHLITLLVAIAGLATIVAGYPNFVFVIIGLILVAFAWFLRPRVGKMPVKIASRERFPVLYKVVDELAELLGAKEVAGIILTPDFNASFQQVGWKRKSILHVGVPLFTILDKDQQIAILAHELAHGVNGDPMRGLFVGTAIESLFHWSYLIRPRQIWEVAAGGLLGLLTALVMVVVNIFLLGLSNLLWYCAVAFIKLVYYDSQRAEYLADYLASTVSGTKAMLSALEKLYIATSFDLLVQRLVLNKQTSNFFTEFRHYVEHLPESELERRRRLSMMEDTRLDNTHPPTANRVAFLAAHAVETPTFVISEVDAQKIEQEFMSVEPEIRSVLKTKYESRLYY